MAKDNINDMDIDEILRSVKRSNNAENDLEPPIQHYAPNNEGIENNSAETVSEDETQNTQAELMTQKNETISEEKVKKGNKQSNKKKGLSKIAKIIIIIAAVIVVIGAAFGIVAIATHDNPFTYTYAAVTNSQKKLIANWESDSAPGLSAYVFHDDGTYDSYISSYNFTGKYEVTVNKLTLINTLTNQENVYKYRISGKVLYLTLIEENGQEVEEQESSKYNKVDNLNMKSLSDIIDSLKSEGSK